jgi:hypothetical protein
MDKKKGEKGEKGKKKKKELGKKGGFDVGI